MSLTYVLDSNLLKAKELTIKQTEHSNKWHLVVTTAFLAGRKLADDFLSIRKDPPAGGRLYTVHLLYPDYMSETYGHDDYLTTVTAESPEQAFREAVKLVRDSHPDELQEDHDMHVLGIYEGEVQDLNPYRNGEGQEDAG